MDEFGNCHVPAFGSWNDMQFGDHEYCYEFPNYYGDRDLYVTGDLYGYEFVSPTVIVLPRPRRKSRYTNVSEPKKVDWVGDVKEPPSPVLSIFPKKAYKPVDEDLYKISPELLYSKPNKKKKGWGIFSSCCIPNV